MLFLFVGGCADGAGDGSVQVPDDDDSAIDSDPGDDDTVPGDDDTVAGDDDAGDDDTTPPPAPDCNVQSVIDASCTELQWRQPSMAVAMSSCPNGDYYFGGAIEWALFLDTCGGVATDPLSSHNWSEEAMLVTIRSGPGCDLRSEVLWFAECSTGFHFGHAFELCGDCTTTQVSVKFIAVPAGNTPVEFHHCRPDDFGCDS
jgi:hypothetical protein